jgi:septum formation protein
MITKTAPPHLVLASGSRTRSAMLRQAGLKIAVHPADLDERAIKLGLQTGSTSGAAIAAALAQAKARAVARQYPNAWVIGADQVLSCDGVMFDKAPDFTAAKATLQRLEGRRHELHAAVCVVRNNGSEDIVLWQHVGTAHLWMRSLSDDFIAGYLDQAGQSVLWSVGCYQIEGLGVQLFDRIDGDHFTILGLPLLPLLNYLRLTGLLQQ